VFALNIIGTLGWVVALVGLALIARRAGAARSEWIFLGLAGLFLLGGHPFPFGTITFGCVFIAALLHEISRSSSASAAAGRVEPSDASSEPLREA
jgi:ABC-type Mn2+/Zn2+ transport system permease subunit